MHAPRRTIRLCAGLAAACCVACDGGEHRVEVLLDRAACSPSCAKPSYEIYVHEQRATGRCARHRATAGADALIPALSFAAGATVIVGAAVLCSSSSGGSTGCCADLALCIGGAIGSAECKQAATSCPAEANPYTGDMKTYYAKHCAAAPASACVECHGEQLLRLDGDARVSVAVTKAAVACGSSAEPVAPACP